MFIEAARTLTAQLLSLYEPDVPLGYRDIDGKGHATRDVVEWINKLENQAQSLGGVRRSCRQPISERQRCSESDTKFRFRTESLWLIPKAMA